MSVHCLPAAIVSLESLSLKPIRLFFLASFKLFSGCLYNSLLCLCFWQFYYDISVSVFFLPFGLLLVIFFVACLIIFA